MDITFLEFLHERICSLSHYYFLSCRTCRTFSCWLWGSRSPSRGRCRAPCKSSPTFRKSSAGSNTQKEVSQRVCWSCVWGVLPDLDFVDHLYYFQLLLFHHDFRGRLDPHDHSRGFDLDPRGCHHAAHYTRRPEAVPDRPGVALTKKGEMRNREPSTPPDLLWRLLRLGFVLVEYWHTHYPRSEGSCQSFRR